jgi:hypothetical protein
MNCRCWLRNNPEERSSQPDIHFSRRKLFYDDLLSPAAIKLGLVFM